MEYMEKEKIEPEEFGIGPNRRSISNLDFKTTEKDSCCKCHFLTIQNEKPIKIEITLGWLFKIGLLIWLVLKMKDHF